MAVDLRAGPLAEMLAAKRDQILQICQAHGASNLAVFGSVARGQSKHGSDLDLLVDLEPTRSLLDHIGLQQALEDLLGMKVDVVTRQGLHPMLRGNILSEAVPV